jgi:Putative lumazine-binding
MNSSILLVAILLQAPTAPPKPQDDRARVIAAVQSLFDAMERSDAELARKVLMPDARLFSAAERDGTVTVRPSTGESFIAGFSNPNRGKVLERMWDPDVRVQASIAQVWTRYDVHINGTFSHCRIDAFGLVKIDDSWKVASVMWTADRTGCAPSPLGPPK